MLYKKSFIALATLFGLTTVAFAGPGSTGGGSGCMAEIMTDAVSISQLIDGVQAKLPVTGESFLENVDPKIFHFTTDDLTYQGNPVDAFFDGKQISVRCDRLLADPLAAQRKVIAHEIFRKMGLEGDRYELSKLIPGLLQSCETKSQFFSSGHLNFDGSCTFDNPQVLFDGKMMNVVEIGYFDTHVGFCKIAGYSNYSKEDYNTAGGLVGVQLKADGTFGDVATTGVYSSNTVVLAVSQITCAN